MENMPSGGVWRTVWRICLLGGYGERYGEYAFWGGYGEQYGEYAFWGGGMENSVENMPSRGVWRTVWRIAFSGGGGLRG